MQQGLKLIKKKENVHHQGNMVRQIQVRNRYYQQNLVLLKSAITPLWVKNAYLVSLQLSNSGLSVELIASNKLINQSLHC